MRPDLTGHRSVGANTPDAYPTFGTFVTQNPQTEAEAAREGMANGSWLLVPEPYANCHTPGQYMSSINARYLFVTTLRFAFRLGVNSPPSTLKSRGRMR